MIKNLAKKIKKGKHQTTKMKKEITILEHVTTHTSATMHFTWKYELNIYISIYINLFPHEKQQITRENLFLSLSFLCSKSIFPLHSLSLWFLFSIFLFLLLCEVISKAILIVDNVLSLLHDLIRIK